MRPIKFRARVRSGHLKGEWTYWQMGDHPKYDELDLETLGQFTGLHGKNGKEIWEGDIVMVLDRDWMSCSGCHKTPQEHMRDVAFKCPVVFEDGMFILKSDLPNKFDGKYDYISLKKEYGRDIFEVLGNIYEHKELLK